MSKDILDFEFRVLFESVPNGVILVDQDGKICLANAEAEKLFGYFRDELIGQLVEIVIPVRFRADHVALRHMFQASTQTRVMGGGRALFARTRDGTEIRVAIGLRPFQYQGRPLVLASIVDVTERTTIMRELAYRSKNLLTIVAIAHQSVKESADLATFKENFEGRLEALAHSIDLVIEWKWLGVPLDDLVQVQMEPFVGAGGRIESVGPPVTLKPDFAQRLGLALHELATNAVKYGALCAPEGKVAIRWEFDDRGDRKLRMAWTESGGPRVTPPVRTGFGHKLLASLKEAGFCDEMEIEFSPDGLVWRIECQGFTSLRTPTQDGGKFRWKAECNLMLAT